MTFYLFLYLTTLLQAPQPTYNSIYLLCFITFRLVHAILSVHNAQNLPSVHVKILIVFQGKCYLCHQAFLIAFALMSALLPVNSHITEMFKHLSILACLFKALLIQH